MTSPTGSMTDGVHRYGLTRGGDALAAISVDGDVGAEVGQALLELPEVTRAVVVGLG